MTRGRTPIPLVSTWIVGLLCVLVEARGMAQGEPSTQQIRWSLAELGLSEERLASAEETSLAVNFTARADQVWRGARLDLVLDPALAPRDLVALEVLLQGEQEASFSREEIARNAGRLAVQLSPSNLSSANSLSLRMRLGERRSECINPAPGSWRFLVSGALSMTSVALPLPADLDVLPLPFVDPEFEDKEPIHVVFAREPSERSVHASALVTSWFALQSKARLAFRAHVRSLPAAHAVVLVDDADAASALGLSPGLVPAAGATLSMVSHPFVRDRRLLVVAASHEALLERAARGLLRDGYALRGPSRVFDADVELSARADAPRWVDAHREIVLARLPGRPVLEVKGGRSQTLRIPFRTRPDLFLWPEGRVRLDLSVLQEAEGLSGLAQVHVAFNDVSLGRLPRARGTRTLLSIPREALRGYNELLLHVSYPKGAHPSACTQEPDASGRNARVTVGPSSRIQLRGTHEFALLPNLRSFLYDGFPFTARADQSATLVVLPSAPEEPELSTFLDLSAHFSSITGQPPSGLRVALGAPTWEAQRSRDVLAIAAQGRLPWLVRWAERLPLDVLHAGDRELEKPPLGIRAKRYLRGRFDDDDFRHAQELVHGSAFSAVLGLPGGTHEGRDAVLVTASEPARMPDLKDLLHPVRSDEPYHDLLLITDSGRALLRLGAEHGRGELPLGLWLRFWLAHYWLLLIPGLLLAALLLALFAHRHLTLLSARRLAPGVEA